MTIALPEVRIATALDLAMRYGSIDGDHHKMWVIDQMVRKLLGPVEYKTFVKHYEAKQNAEWETGVAP